jgi:hypothetical protein
MEEQDPKPLRGDPSWFREPTGREQWIGFGLFLGFGIFFLLFYYVERDTGYRWVILGLAVVSLGRSLRHGIKAWYAKR